jgi:hypothetical protein
LILKRNTPQLAARVRSRRFTSTSRLEVIMAYTGLTLKLQVNLNIKKCGFAGTVRLPHTKQNSA